MLAVGSDTAIENRERRLRLLLLQRFPVEVQNVLKFIRRQLLWYAKCEVIVIVCVFVSIEAQRFPLVSQVLPKQNCMENVVKN